MRAGRSAAGSSILLIALAGVAVACSGKSAPDRDSAQRQAPINGEPVSKTVELGPVKATVTVVPAKPKVGDRLRLVLRVEAEKNVDVEMPPGGEALGRFRILDHKQDDGDTADGKRFFEHRLTMRPGGSGKQRVPKLRIEFVDNRKVAGLDAGVAKPQELLTDEVEIEVQSVSPEGEVSASLRGARGELKPPSHSAYGWLWPLLFAVLVSGLVAGSLTWYLRRRDSQVKVSAYEAAITGLDELTRRGMPAPAQADAWYVELSAIVRRYLEGRYGLRAPELTTEEFLREARRSAELSDQHRALLSSFLERCDRVKFAGYQPDPAESKELLEAARGFVEETRVVDEPGAEAALTAVEDKAA